MKKFLKTLSYSFVAFGVAGALAVGAKSTDTKKANADSLAFTVTFKDGSETAPGNCGTSITASTPLSAIFNSGASTYINGVSSTSNCYYSTKGYKNGIRVGKKDAAGDITFSLKNTVDSVSKIVIKACQTSKSNSNTLTAYNTTYTPTALDTLTDYEFTVGQSLSSITLSSSMQVMVKSISVYQGSITPELNLDKTNVSMYTTDSPITITASASGFTPTSYSWSIKGGSDDCVSLTNANSATVTVTPKAISGEKSATLVASASDGSEIYTAEAIVNVCVKKGTSDNPYTVADAIAAIDRGVAAELTNVYTRGIVSKVDSFNSTYGSITYWISDDGVTTNQFEVYGGLGLNNTKFDDIYGLKVGDEVIVYGTMKKFNSIYEYDKNSYLTYLGGQTIELTSIDSISGTLSVAEGATSWDLTQLTPMGKINNGEITNISDYVTLSTEDVPGAAGSYTVNVTVSPKDSETVSPKTIGVNGTVIQLEGPVPNGRYYIVNVTRNAALSAAPSTSRISGTELSESNDAMPFDLVLVADNTYEITVTQDGTKYYLLNNNIAASSANDNVRVIEKTSAVSGLKSFAWTVEQFAEQEEGVYTIKQNTTGSTNRFLTCFYQSKQAAECDFRGYVTSYSDAASQDSRFKLVPEFAWANEIVSGLNAGGLCDGGITAPSKTTWGELSSITYTANELNYLANLNASEVGTLAEQAMARYDFIMRKYNTTAVINYADFIGRISAGKVTLNVYFESFMDNASSPALAIIMMSMATFAGFGIVVKKVNSKRKED